MTNEIHFKLESKFSSAVGWVCPPVCRIGLIQRRLDKSRNVETVATGKIEMESNNSELNLRYTERRTQNTLQLDPRHEKGEAQHILLITQEVVEKFL